MAHCVCVSLDLEMVYLFKVIFRISEGTISCLCMHKIKEKVVLLSPRGL